jgi:hypothetical protein
LKDGETLKFSVSLFTSSNFMSAPQLPVQMRHDSVAS